jgi:hypothetical protein
MQYPPASCHFLHLRSKYSPQHPVLNHPQSMFFPQCENITAEVIIQMSYFMGSVLGQLFWRKNKQWRSL